MIELVRLLDRLLVAVARRRTPSIDLVALLDLLALELDSRRAPCGACAASGVCQRITSGTKLSISAGFSRQLAVLLRMLAQRVDAAGQRVARGVVAADDQQDQVAEEVRRNPCSSSRRCAPSSRTGRSSAAGLTRSSHSRLRNRSRTPSARPARSSSVATRPPAPGRVVATSDQRVSLRRSSQGKSNSTAEHLRGQLDRDLVDPVEHLAARQIVEALGRALADVERELVEMRRREHRRHRLALRRCAAAGPWR